MLVCFLMQNTDLTFLIEKYKGLWVALNENLTCVISADESLKKAQETAIKKGTNEPIMFKVPKSNRLFIG